MMRLVQPGRSAAWTKERIDALTTPEIRQLRENALVETGATPSQPGLVPVTRLLE